MANLRLDKRAVIAQIDDVLSGFERAKRASTYDDFSGGLPDDELQAIAVRLKAAVARLTTPESIYGREAEHVKGHFGVVVRDLGGILQALKADVEADYVQTLAELVHAELFDDFLDMADELQEKGYKDAAAVVAGSVLEEHLRKLASKAGIPTTKPDGSAKKADTLNSELAKATVYNKLDQKSVTAWLGLRNDAAHGNYGEYDQSQVSSLIRDVRSFLSRFPA